MILLVRRRIHERYKRLWFEAWVDQTMWPRGSMGWRMCELRMKVCQMMMDAFS